MAVAIFGIFQVVGQFEAQVSGVGGVRERGFEFNLAVANHFFDFAVEVLHAFGVAVAHGIEQDLPSVSPFSTYSRVRMVDLRISMAAMRPLLSFLGKQALRNDEAESFGEAGADGLLIGERENADDTLDGFGSVDGVQSGHDQVAGFGSFESDFNGFAIAHFADENYFGRLAQGGAQGESETGSVGVEFALVDGALFVAMQKLDGVFDGEDVKGLFLIHFVEDGGEGGRFAGAGRAGDEDDAVAQLHDFLEGLRED